MWAKDYSSLNYNGESTLPSGYKYYGSSTGVESPSSFSTTTCDNVTVFDVTAGGSGAYNKRCIEFTITEDCSVEVKLHTGNNGRVFRMYNGSSTVVKEVTLTSKGNEYTFTYDFTGATPSSPKTYSFSGSGSKTYISKITFTSSCSATAPGNISKGTLSAGILTLNAAGSPATNNVWYWQTSATGTDKTNSGTSFNVSAAGTYYVRSLYDNDCWSAAKSITVNATDLVANYTVTYKDGTTTLGSEVVAVGQKPTATGITTAKDCYTFAAWQLNNTDKALTDDSWASVAAETEVTLTARYTPVYSSSATLISDANVSAKTNVNTIFAASNIVSSITFTSGNYEFTSNETKKGYYGYKDKASGDYMKIMLQQGKRVQVLFGSLDADPTITVNGVAKTLDAARAKGDNVENTFTWTASAEDALISITMGSGTSTLKSVTIEDIPALDNDATLSDLKVGGVTVPGFSAGTHTYYYEVPYGTALADFPQISATAHSAKAKQVAIEQAVWTGEPYNCYRAQANVQAQDESWGYYDVRFYFGPKFGVELIKVATTGGTNKTVTGLYAGEGDVNLSDNKKMDKYKYIGFTLDGTTLQAGDQINVHTSSAATQGGSHVIFYNNMTDKNELYDTEAIGGKGNNMFTINAAMVDHATAYVYRSDADNPHKWNGYIDYLAVYRLMAPFIESFEIAGIGALTIDQENKAITAEVSQDFDVAALTPTIKYWGNGGGAIDKDGAQDFTSPVTYTVSSAYADDATGDYAPVTYTVTITKVVPSATPSITTQPQGANYYEGASIAALSVEASVTDGGTLSYQWYLGADAIDGATEATYTPTVSAIGSYSYKCEVTNKKDDKPAASVMSSVATIVIAEDPATIKLLNGSAVNTTNFITGVTATETVEFMGNTVNYAKFAGTVSNVNGVKDLARVIAYNATTNKTKIQISAHNNSTSGRSILVKGLVEGADAAVDLATIALGNKEDKVSDWIEFDNAANRTIYIFVGSSAGDVYFTQVKVVESGETTLKRAGEAGYSLNFNKGRFFGVKDKTAVFEGMSVAVKSSDCQPLNTSVVKLASSSMSFDVAAPVTLTVTTNNSNTYYVGTSTSATTNATAYKGASEFDLTAGTWYINAGSSNVEITNIAFAMPKAEKPTITTQPATKLDFGAGDMTATVVATADGTLSYQWFNASDDSEVAGATEATLTTATEGTYYVVVTNSKAGYQDNTIKSDNAELKHRQLNDATLSALSYGGTAITLEDGVYEYAVLLDEGTTVVPALSATATMAAYGATAVPTDAAAFVDYKATSTVLVTAEDGATTQTYTVKFTVQHEYAEIEDVTGNTSWNWAGVADVTEGDGIVVDGSHGLVLANYIAAVNFEKLEAHVGARAYRSNSYPAYQGTSLRFHTTVAGKLVINARRSSGSPLMKVNGAEIATLTATLTEYVTFVPAGDVTITVTGNEMRIYAMEFQVLSEITPSYTRDNLNPANIGTLCWENDGVLFGGTVYELTGKDENNKLVFDEVVGNVIKGGKPCIFVPENGNTEIKVYNTKNEDVDAGEFNGMKGTFVDLSSADGETLWGNYVISNNKYIYVDADNVSLKAYRAYILSLDNIPSAVPTQNSNGAPRRRIVMGAQGEQTATGFENLNASEKPVKLMIDGQIYILRGEKLYDATGRLVK